MSFGAARSHMNQRRRLSIVLLLNIALILGLVFAGLASRSVGVPAAAGDPLADSAALILGLIAVAQRDRHPDDPGANKPIATAALINAALLVAFTIGDGSFGPGQSDSLPPIRSRSQQRLPDGIDGQSRRGRR